MTPEPIYNYIREQNLDIRKTNNARFMDQKCTPDVISTIAECIQNYPESVFCTNDIWNSQFAAETIESFFQKPNTVDTSVSNEYDKFFGQPIKMMHYAGILELVQTKKGRSLYYKVINKDLLNYLAVRDKNAYQFLTIYLTEVLKQSDLYRYFENFFKDQNRRSFDTLKSQYENFIIANTPINNVTEVRRIFTKVLNPLAVHLKKLGTRSGRLSKDRINYNELLYNRINFRDTDKPKDISRAEFLKSLPKLNSHEVFQVEKAKRQVKKYHNEISEVHPNLQGKANHAHHIFPQSEYLDLSDTFENLIVLTANEHFEFAHSNSSTSSISLGYQMMCLLSKTESIRQSLVTNNDNFYDLDSFINVLEVGLNTTLNQVPNDTSDAIDYLTTFILDYYLNNFGSNPYNLSPSELLPILKELHLSNSPTVSHKLTKEINALFNNLVISNSTSDTKYALNQIVSLAIK